MAKHRAGTDPAVEGRRGWTQGLAWTSPLIQYHLEIGMELKDFDSAGRTSLLIATVLFN